MARQKPRPYAACSEAEKEQLRARQRAMRERARSHAPIIDGIESRFWSRVDKKPNGCWEWMATTHRGYGRIVYRGQDLETHRVSWILAHGPIPDGLWVLHHCDNRKCVRTDHLFLGTIQDNTHDCVAKGRNCRGEKKRQIMLRCAAKGDRNGARLYPERLMRGDAHWTRTSPERMKPRCGERHMWASLTLDQAVEIVRLRRDGNRIKDIAAKFGVEPHAVSRIVHGHRWRRALNEVGVLTEVA